MSTIPTEIWSRVISFLVRDTPPPREYKHWFGLSQPDLCTSMRVNSTFHELTAPYLYNKVAVADLVAFMRNFDPSKAKPDNRIKPGIKTKNELLACVRNIDFVYIYHPIEPTYRDLYTGSEKGWKDLAPKVNYKQLRSVEEIGPQFDAFNNIKQVRIGILAAKETFSPFPKLDRIVIGGSGPGSWPERQVAWRKLPGNDLSTMLELCSRARTAPLSILSAATPSHCCVHTIYGPLTTPLNRLYNPQKPNSIKSFTWYLQEPLTRPLSGEPQRWPTIICGTVNRWITDQQSARYNLATETIGNALLDIASVFDEMLGFSKYSGPGPGGEEVDLADTKVEIHAFLDLRPSSTPEIARYAVHKGRIFIEEDKMLADAQSLLDEMLIAEWKGKVELKLSYLAPDCECCGYKVKHFPQEGGSPSIEEFPDFYPIYE